MHLEGALYSIIQTSWLIIFTGWKFPVEKYFVEVSLSFFSFHDRNMVEICINTTPKYFAENIFFLLISKNIKEKLTL